MFALFLPRSRDHLPPRGLVFVLRCGSLQRLWGARQDLVFPPSPLLYVAFCVSGTRRRSDGAPRRFLRRSIARSDLRCYSTRTRMLTTALRFAHTRKDCRVLKGAFRGLASLVLHQGRALLLHETGVGRLCALGVEAEARLELEADRVGK